MTTCAVKHTSSFGTSALPCDGLESRFIFFLEKYTPRLRKHGNLVGMSSEGGGHVQQPHSNIVQKRPSRPRAKCPVGLVEIMKHVRLWLELWRQGWLSPALWYTHEPKLQADS